MDLLARTSAAGYEMEPLPSPTDKAVADAVRSILALDTEERSRLSGALSDADYAILALFAERMATEAVRAKSSEAIRLGLAAMALIANPPDIRDYLVLLPLLNRSAVLVGAEPRALFAEAAHIASTDLGKAMQSYSEQPEVPTIQQMGYFEDGAGETFRYVRR